MTNLPMNLTQLAFFLANFSISFYKIKIKEKKLNIRDETTNETNLHYLNERKRRRIPCLLL